MSIITRQVLIMKWQVPGVGEAGVSRYTEAMRLDAIPDLFGGGRFLESRYCADKDLDSDLFASLQN